MRRDGLVMYIIESSVNAQEKKQIVNNATANQRYSLTIFGPDPAE